MSVVTLTFRRPADLVAALPPLAAQVAAIDGAELVVVDNDPEASARSIVEGAELGCPWRYVWEPRPGIAAARNRALDECSSSDVLIFVDDDERPSDGWLPALLDTYRRYECTGVAGRVVSSFDGAVDPFLEAGGFFDRLRHPTGTLVPVVATNNLLIGLVQVRSWGIRFDEQFGLSGGSDTVFALEVGRHGGSFVWCDEAVVVDVVPASRLTRSWVLRRAFRSGNSGSRAAVHVEEHPLPRWRARAVHTSRGLARLLGGALRAGAGALRRDEPTRIRGLRTAVRGAGMVTGALGYVYSEYKRRAAA